MRVYKNKNRHHPYTELMKQLDYSFSNLKLLNEALTHRSFGMPNNERLEFIGDSILNYVVARLLFEQFPNEPEGTLSRLRANLVNQHHLASLAQALNLGCFLKLGEGELRSGGQNRPSILADALEAIFAAICLDKDFSEAERVIAHLFLPKITSQSINERTKDAKTRLQEWLQGRKFALPEYQVVACLGEAHAQYFHVRCHLPALNVTSEGQGTSRRRAEQAAAEAALECLSAQK